MLMVMPIAVRHSRDLANLARSQRQALGLTQAEVAEQAGVSLRWLASFEKNGGGHVDKIFAVLGVVGVALTGGTKPDQHSQLLHAYLARHANPNSQLPQ